MQVRVVSLRDVTCKLISTSNIPRPQRIPYNNVKFTVIEEPNVMRDENMKGKSSN